MSNGTSKDGHPVMAIRSHPSSAATENHKHGHHYAPSRVSKEDARALTAASLLHQSQLKKPAQGGISPIPRRQRDRQAERQHPSSSGRRQSPGRGVATLRSADSPEHSPNQAGRSPRSTNSPDLAASTVSAQPGTSAVPSRSQTENCAGIFPTGGVDKKGSGSQSVSSKVPTLSTARATDPGTSSTPHTSPHSPKRRRRGLSAAEVQRARLTERRTLITAVTVAGVTLLASVLAILVMQLKFGGMTHPLRTCNTAGCLEHASQLLQAFNREADPCQDFYEYVCGNWGRVSNLFFADHMRFKAAGMVLHDLREEAVSQQPVDWVPAFYATCMEPSKDSFPPALAHFAEWKKSLGLLWPELLQTPTPHPLDVLLSLGLRWNIHLVFTTRVLTDHRRRPQTVFFLSRGTLDPHLKRREEALQGRSFRDSVALHIKLLTWTPTTTNLTELRDTENALYDISRQSSDPTGSQVWFPLYVFGRYMHSVSADLWEDLLAKHVANTSVHLNANDTVFVVQSSRLLTALDKLFKAYAAKPERLLEGIAWVFMQMFLWTTKGDIRRLKFGDVTPELAPHVCAVFVESRLGMRAAASSVRNRFNSSVRAEFNSFIRGLVKTLRSSLKKLPWIDKGALRKAQLKLSNLTIDMFPTEDFFTDDGVAELYDDFAAVAHKSDKLSFIQYFILYSETLRRYLGTERYEDVYRRRLTDVARQLTEYLYWPNLLQVSMAALQPPLHSLDGTYSMNFGGLGSYLMRELSRSFDMAGAFADTQGSASAWWGPNKTSDYKGKLECYRENSETGEKHSGVAGANASKERPVELFSDLPALEAAFSAYTQALAQTGDHVDVVQLPFLESYSGHQIFFLTYCHVMCGRSRHNAGRCNLPLRNFLPFAKAFHCPVGSAMNPAKKCSFFENSVT